MRIIFVVCLLIFSSGNKAIGSEKSEEFPVFQAKTGNNSYLIMESIKDICTELKWKGFAKHKIEEVNDKDLDNNYVKLSALKDSFTQFQNHLRSNNIYHNNVWVAYASDMDATALKKLYANSESQWEEHIEMSVAIAYFPNDPFYVPNGISRNPSYSGEFHHNLSVNLHSFAAKMMKKELNHAQKIYAIIKPLDCMRTILKIALASEPESYQEGHNQQDSWIEEIRGNYGRAERELNEKAYRFMLKDKAGTTLFEINSENKKQYEWFLGIGSKYLTIKVDILAGFSKFDKLDILK
jgi:hypothetical protein